MVEYALILVLIAVVVIVVLIILGNQVKNVFCNISAASASNHPSLLEQQGEPAQAGSLCFSGGPSRITEVPQGRALSGRYMTRRSVTPLERWRRLSGGESIATEVKPKQQPHPLDLRCFPRHRGVRRGLARWAYRTVAQPRSEWLEECAGRGGHQGHPGVDPDHGDMVTVQQFSSDQAPPYAFRGKDLVVWKYAAIPIHLGQAIIDYDIVADQGSVQAPSRPSCRSRQAWSPCRSRPASSSAPAATSSRTTGSTSSLRRRSIRQHQPGQREAIHQDDLHQPSHHPGWPGGRGEHPWDFVEPDRHRDLEAGGGPQVLLDNTKLQVRPQVGQDYDVARRRHRPDTDQSFIQTYHLTH